MMPHSRARQPWDPSRALSFLSAWPLTAASAWDRAELSPVNIWGGPTWRAIRDPDAV